MAERTQVPLFDSSAVKEALERLRQARPLGNSPLRRLIWLEQQAEEHGPLVAPAGIEVALWDALIGMIEQRHRELRTLEQLEFSPEYERADVIRYLRADFAANNDELRAWSILYHRYARIDLNLKIQELATLLRLDSRQVRRHMNHGLRRLTEQLSHLEVQARAMNWQLWLKSKLPPPSYATIFGLEEPLEQILAILRSPLPPKTIIITGPGGSGKTTLARLAAQHLIDQLVFKDLAWLTIEPPVTYQTILVMLAKALGYYHLAQSEPSEMEGSLRVRLEANPTIVVIDNAEYVENYEDMFPRLNSLIAAGRILALMRPQPPQSNPVRVFPIPRMREADLIGLIRETARLRPIEQVAGLLDNRIQQIARAVGGNPLAAKTAASQLAFLPVDRVLSGLAQSQTPEGDLLFDRLYGSLWEMLTPDAQRVAIALSFLSNDSADWNILQQITGFSPKTLDTALGDLGAASFIDALELEMGYSMPPLARTFVIEQAKRVEWQDIYRQLLDATISSQQGAALTYETGEEEGVEDANTLLALMARQVAISVPPEQIAVTALAVADQAKRAGLWAAWRDVLRYVVDGLTTLSEDQQEVADIFLELGIAARWLGDFEEAISSFRAGIEGFRAQNRAERQSQALIEIGQLYETMGQTDLAFRAYEESLRLSNRQGLSSQMRRALNGLAGLALNNDRPLQALGLLEEAVKADLETPPDGQTLSLLGSAYLASGRVPEALASQQKAIGWFMEQEDYPRLARAHMRMGMAFHADGNIEAAFENLQQGLTLMREMADAFGQARLLTNMGVLYAAHEHWQDALVTWNFALSLQEQLEDRVGSATTLYNIADLEWNLDRQSEAQQHLNRARTIAEDLSLVALLEKIRTHPLVNP